MGIEEVVTAPRSPWQNPFVERVIGSIRRECLDHVIVLNERHLRRIRASYSDDYHRSRTHLYLAKDCPDRGAGAALDYQPQAPSSILTNTPWYLFSCRTMTGFTPTSSQKLLKPRLSPTSSEIRIPPRRSACQISR